MLRYVWLLALVFSCLVKQSQAIETNVHSKFPCAESEVAHYTSYHITEPIKVDGHLEETCWQAAPRSPRLIDIITGKPTFHENCAAVFVYGTLNEDKDRDRGWRVELAFPWQGMKWLAKADNRSLPPKNGDVWRIDFSRFNQYKAAPPDNDSGGWFWSRHGVWDSHIPECFPY